MDLGRPEHDYLLVPVTDRGIVEDHAIVATMFKLGRKPMAAKAGGP